MKCFVRKTSSLTIYSFPPVFLFCRFCRSNLHKSLFNQKDTGYSSHSIVQCMENFVDAVHEMDDTILVPSRLMDLKVDGSGGNGCSDGDCPKTTGHSNDSKVSSSLAAVLLNLPDLFTLYSMVRNLKSQLQWGTKDQQAVREGSASDGTNTPSIGAGGGGGGASNDGGFLSAVPFIPQSTKGHIRRPSTASMSSTGSSTASVLSEPDSEASSIENDSGIDAELEPCSGSSVVGSVVNNKTNTLDTLEQNFQRHLRGLGDTLNQLTEAARYVTKRYQKDVLGFK